MYLGVIAGGKIRTIFLPGNDANWSSFFVFLHLAHVSKLIHPICSINLGGACYIVTTLGMLQTP